MTSVPKIFSSNEETDSLGDAAWKTYIVYCTPSDEAFEILQEQYRRAIDRIETPAVSNSSRSAPDSRLAQHLMSLYWRGKLAADDPNGLLFSFYQKADPKLRYWALDFIGSSLRNTQGTVDSEVLQRLQTLWARRLQALSTLDPSSPEEKELTAFGWWFASRKFSDSRSLEQLLEVLKFCASVEPEHLVVERLAELAASYPGKAVECLELIVDGDKTWGIFGWIDHARRLLAQAINSDDQSARTRAIDLVNRLGALGHLQFRDLLP
jgi:hypothetical protein